jgi:hypothetical protein
MAFPPNSIVEADVSLPYRVTSITMACGKQKHKWYVCHVVDGKAWAHIDEAWLDFGNEI